MNKTIIYKNTPCIILKFDEGISPNYSIEMKNGLVIHTSATNTIEYTPDVYLVLYKNEKIILKRSKYDSYELKKCRHKNWEELIQKRKWYFDYLK